MLLSFRICRAALFFDSLNNVWILLAAMGLGKILGRLRFTSLLLGRFDLGLGSWELGVFNLASFTTASANFSH